MKKAYFHLLISFLILAFPILTLADGGMVVWPRTVYLNQSAQNAIVAWNGEEEIIILSVDVKSSADATALRVIPLPSDPTEIKEGSFESFEKLVEIMNTKIEDIRNQRRELGKGLEGTPSAGVEITFHKKIGAHDVTVVKVNNLDYFLEWIKDFALEKKLEIKEISPEFKEGVSSYLKRDIKYFVFDVIETREEKESIKPLIYKFDSNFLYYPILISGISEISDSRAKIRVFIISEKEISEGVWWPYWRGYFGYPVELSQEELKEVNEDIAELFDGKVRVTTFDYYDFLEKFKKDLVFYSQIWQRDLSRGNQGEDVKTLQKILINEGYWDSEVEATGFFGPITQSALIEFQEGNKSYILEPLNLKTGTGYFGSKTKEFLETGYLLPIEEKIIAWQQNLSLGMRSEEVKALQEILIEEGVWQRPEVGATGYFGSITKEAVIRYQEKYASEILEPLGLTNGTGFVGPSTRAHLEKLTEK